jgi:hypothetical protein
VSWKPTHHPLIPARKRRADYRARCASPYRRRAVGPTRAVITMGCGDACPSTGASATRNGSSKTPPARPSRSSAASATRPTPASGSSSPHLSGHQATTLRGPARSGSPAKLVPQGLGRTSTLILQRSGRTRPSDPERRPAIRASHPESGLCNPVGVMGPIGMQPVGRWTRSDLRRCAMAASARRVVSHF